MTDEQMDEYNLTVVQRSPLYSRDTDSGEKVSSVVQGVLSVVSDAAEMAMNPEKRMKLSDTKLVCETMERYLKSCVRDGAMPTISGFSSVSGLGDYHAFSRFFSRKPEHPTTYFLKTMFEKFADAEVQAGQGGAVHPIFSIFILKSMYGFRENEQIAQPAENPLGEITDTETLMKKYEELTVD